MSMQWKQIDGFPNYEVSEDGLVRSLGPVVKRGSGLFKLPAKVLKPGNDKDGYLQVNLYRNGKGYARKVHVLVADAFIEKVEGKSCVNHKNGIKTHNYKSNLEWCTKKENHDHAVRLKLKVENGDKPVAQFDQTGIVVNIFKSGIEAARQLGYSAGNISNAATGVYKTYKGFTWKYQ